MTAVGHQWPIACPCLRDEEEESSSWVLKFYGHALMDAFNGQDVDIHRKKVVKSEIVG